MVPAPIATRIVGGGRRLIRSADRTLFPEATEPAEHWQRIVMNDAVGELIRDLGPSSLSAAEISGDNHVSRPWKTYTSLDYPAFDICAPLQGSETYDVVICEQVLEHVVDPRAAARNLRALCSPGGWAIVSTPFLIRVHELPMYGLKDYWRFTPRGLQLLLTDAGFSSVEVHSWGNRECILGNMSRWARFRRWMPLRNDPDLPVQVWAYARP